MNRYPFAGGALPEPTEPQGRAIESQTGDVVVGAGPGSGKTRVLVGRMEHLLATGVAPERIAAITFTNRAAAEMKERLRHRLASRWIAARDDGDAHGANHWRSLVWRIEASYLGTIHGFCQSVLRDYPHLAGLDPEFAVIDPYQRRLILEDISREVLDEALGPWDAEHLREMADRRGHGNRFGSSPTELMQRVRDAAMRHTMSWRDVVRVTSDSIENMYYRIGGTPGTWASGGLDSGDTREVIDTVERILELHRAGAASRSKVYPPKVEALAGRWRDLRHRFEAGDAEAALEDLRRALPTKSCPKDYREPVGALHAIGRKTDLRREWAATREFLHAVEEMDRRYETEKERRGVLDFDDLQKLALNTMESHPEFLLRLQRRYSHLLVDEFQDTDEVQWRIVQLIRGESPVGSERDGGVFVVGDADQSIYRFRGADVGIFRSAAEQLRRGGAEDVHLDTNFRSAPDLVDLTNSVFSRRFAEYVTLSPAPEAEASEGQSVEFLMLARPSTGKDRGEFRRRQGEVIADRIETWLSSGGSPGDVAILGRSGNSLEPCGRALAARGIPYRVAGGRGFFESEEVSDLKAVLHWLADASDDISLATVLRSPFFSLEDEILLEISDAAAGSLWDGLCALGAETRDHRLVACQSALATWRAWSRLLPPHELLVHVLENSVYREVLSGHPWAEDAWLNLDRAIALAEKMGGEEGTGYAQLARHLDTLVRVGAADEGTAGSIPEGEVVLSTIHRAKGLEFDTVIIPDADSSQARTNTSFVLDASRGLGLNLPDHSAPFFEDLAAVDKELSLEEEMRIFYVACTRAERRLVLVGGAGEEPESAEDGIPPVDAFGKNAYFGWYAAGLEPQHAPAIRVTHLDLARLENAGAPRDRDRSSGDAAELLAHYGKVADLGLPDPLPPGKPAGMQTYSVTALTDYLQCPRLYLLRHRLGWPELAPEVDPGAPGRDRSPLDPMRFGTLVHRACELLLEESVEGAVIAAMREAALWEGADGMAGVRRRMLELVRVFAESTFFRAFRTAHRSGDAYSEWGFLEEVPGLEDRYISGVVDALYRAEEGDWRVVDYKTDRVSAGGIAERAESYRFQLELYLGVVGKSYYPATDAYLHFLHPGVHHRLPPGEEGGEDVFARARQLIRNIEDSAIEADFPKHRGGRCNWCGFAFHCDSSC